MSINISEKNKVVNLERIQDSYVPFKIETYVYLIHDKTKKREENQVTNAFRAEAFIRVHCIYNNVLVHYTVYLTTLTDTIYNNHIVM